MFSKSTIKYIQSLQHKKFRDEAGTFLAEGPKVVTELLQSGRFGCDSIYCMEDWFTDAGIRSGLETSDIHFVKEHELAKMTGLSTANKIIAVFRQRQPAIDFDATKGLTLVLDGIQDPGNLGTIIRSADWFGVKNIVCSQNTADLYNPKVVQSTMASLGKVNVSYTVLEEWLSIQSGIPKFAATINGKPLTTFAKTRSAIIIIGNESKGISSSLLAMADEKITIPRIGEAESLNAAVATAIILYAMNN